MFHRTQTVTERTTPLAKREEPQVKIYGPSPITVVSAGATAVLLARRGLPARAATAPTCLALYSPAAIRLSSACDCLSITSSTITTISTAPTNTTVSIFRALETVEIANTPNAGDTDR